MEGDGNGVCNMYQWGVHFPTVAAPPPGPTPTPTPNPPSNDYMMCARNRYVAPDTYTFWGQAGLSRSACKAACLARSDCSMFTHMGGACYLEGTQALTRLHESGWLGTSASADDRICVVRPNTAGGCPVGLGAASGVGGMGVLCRGFSRLLGPVVAC